MSLVNTLMQPLINKYDGKLDSNERRFAEYGFWDFAQTTGRSADSVLSAQNRQIAENSYGITAKIPVLNYDQVSIGSSYSCTVGEVESTTDKVTITYTPYSFGFTMFPSQYMNSGQAMNYIAYEQDWQAKMTHCLLAFMEVLDTSVINAVEAAKNTYWATNIANYYPESGDALLVSAAQEDDFYNQFSAIMREMRFNKPTHICGGISLLPKVNRLKNQSSQNAVNQSFQLDPYKWHTSNFVTNATGIRSTLYGIQEGQIAVTNRNAPTFRNKQKIGMDLYEWDLVQLPIAGIQVGSFYKQECADSTGKAAVAETATVKESFGFNTEVAIITTYNSSPSTNENPFVKVQISAS